MLTEFLKKKAGYYPMPNTGTVLDISAGHWVLGHKGQMCLNGGLSMWSCIAALPNMFKTTTAARMCGMTLLAFENALVHAHDTETTMVESRIERLILDSMSMPLEGLSIPDNLSTNGKLFFTSSVDYNGTELMSLLKKMAAKRFKEEAKIKCEMIDDRTGQPYEWWNPIVELWDSFSGMNAQSAEDMLEDGDVGTKDLNMLAMRVNSGKSQIVEQLPSFTAKHAIYVLATAHVGQSYQLDPRKPNVRTLRFLKGDIKLKRVPENLSFTTGNCYIITRLQPMVTDGKPEFPYSPGDEMSGSDLIELTFTNMRGKFGPSDVPHTLAVSQRDGWSATLSNFLYLRENGRYGFEGNLQNYSFVFTPDIKLRRTTVRQKCREHFSLHTAMYHLVNMHWMFTRWDVDLMPEVYRCTPEELYADIIALGYDWNLLLNCRYWHGEIKDPSKDIPFLSTFDLLRIRTNDYHPYWYPVAKKDMVPVVAAKVVTKSKEVDKMK